MTAGVNGDVSGGRVSPRLRAAGRAGRQLDDGGRAGRARRRRANAVREHEAEVGRAGGDAPAARADRVGGIRRASRGPAVERAADARREEQHRGDMASSPLVIPGAHCATSYIPELRGLRVHLVNRVTPMVVRWYRIEVLRFVPLAVAGLVLAGGCN